MAYLNPRYAAFLKKHGRSDLDQSTVFKSQSPPRKFDPQHAGTVVRIANGDVCNPGAGLEDVATYAVIPQAKTPVAPSISSTINTKKRPATPDVSVAVDLFSSDSPTKFSRTPFGKHSTVTTDQPSVRERLEEFSLSVQPLNLPGDSSNKQTGTGISRGKGSPLKDEGFNAFKDNSSGNAAGLTLRHKLIAQELATDSFHREKEERGELGQVDELRNKSRVPNAAFLDVNEMDEETEYELPVNTCLVSQPESKPITQDQLTTEVKAIYAGLVLIEAKCINVVNAQSVASAQSGEASQPDSAHWQAMIALHRTLLHEHHDFLLASQHPSASQPLRNLALKYSMPARMWKHGIHNFLELLRRRLPHSLEFMLSFIYMAYQMIALLYETVPSFKETWIECLGDLSRYRMAIEDEDQSDRDTWTGVARYWYSKAADKTPAVGRLYHHLAILSRSQALQQLSLYCRSLSSLQIFQSARESIMTLFEPILARSTSTGSRPLSVESWFIRCHALIFAQRHMETFVTAITNFLTHLSDHIVKMEGRWKLQGAYIAISNVASLLLYGSLNSTLREMFVRKASIADVNHPIVPEQPLSPHTIPKNLSAWKLIIPTFDLILKHTNRDDALPHIHVMFVFIWRLALLPRALDCLHHDIPWISISKYLNNLITPDCAFIRIENRKFPSSEKGNRQQLPEDFLIRGLVWSQEYFPDTWFNDILSEDERMVELPNTKNLRAERVLWLGVRIASSFPQNKPYLRYDASTKCFHQPVHHELQLSYPFHDPLGSFTEKIPSLHSKFHGNNG